MKVLFVLPLNGISGGLNVLFELARHLHAMGADVDLAFDREEPPLPITSFRGVEHIPAFYLSDIGGRGSYDVAIASWWETAFRLERVQARHFAYFVQDFEDRFYVAPERAARLLVRKTYEENFAFFTVSQALADRLRREFGKQACVVRPGIHVERYDRAAPALPPASGALRVLVEGPSSHERKRVPAAFDVLRGLDGFEVVFLTSDGIRRPDWHIDHFFAQVPYQDTPGIYKSIDIVLKLSRQESFALPVLEGFAAGATAVVTGFEGHDEYIRHEGNALVVPLHYPERAADALTRLRDDPALLARLRADARRTAQEFDWTASCAAFVRELERIVQEPPSALDVLPRLQEEFADYCQVMDERRELHALVRRQNLQLDFLLGHAMRRRLEPAMRWAWRRLRASAS
jgi:glycosyltransferase involved in cell wall biosynthesis